MNHIITSSPKTAIIPDSFEEYAQFPAVNNSALSLFEEALGGCPAKAAHYMLHTHGIDSERPELEEDEPEPSEALRFGNLFHHYLLERANFDNSAVILDEDRQNGLYQQALVSRYADKQQALVDRHAKLKTKPDFEVWAKGKLLPFEEWVKSPPLKGFSKTMTEYKTWKAKVEADGREVVDGKKHLQMQMMERALLACPEIKEALEVPRKSEVSLYWGMPLDPRDSSSKMVQCKCRIDALPLDGPFVDDLKSTRSAAPEEFAKAIWRYRYDRQAAWYLRGCAALGLKGKTAFRFLAQEKEAPYACALYTLPTSWLNFANKEVNKTFMEMKAAISSGIWKGYGSGEVLPPTWLEDIIDQESSIPFVGGGAAA